MRTLRLTSALALVAAAVASSATPAAADPITGPIAGPSIGDGVLVYSQRDAEGLWSLHQRDRAGALRRLPVARSQNPFDVDMGQTADNETVAVYSRCATVCRIYELALDSGQERLVPGVHARGHSETMPTLHHGVLGFQRHRAGEDPGQFSGERGSYRLIALRPGARSRQVKTLRSGQTVTGADLSARGLALSTHRGEPGRTEVSVQAKPANRPFRTLQAAASGELSAVQVTPPSWRGNHVYWGYARAYDAPSLLLLRARVTAAGTDVRQTTAPNPLGESGAVISGVAADDVDSEQPLWIGATTLYDESDGYDRTGLDAYPLGSLEFLDR